MFLLERPRSVKNGSEPSVHQNTKFATVITVVLEAPFHESASFRVHPYELHVFANHQYSQCFRGAIAMIEKIHEDGLKPSFWCATMMVRQLGIERWKSFTYNKSI